jgi:inosine-uridine nucleoside N-ribohydrolase
MSKKPSCVIIDMDGGIDDALALILGLRSPEIEVVGITSVSGNVSVNQATLNALRVVELLTRPEVWVAQGLARPLARDPIRAFDFHGRDGLGDSHLPPPKLHRANKTALTATSETLSSCKKHELTIICTGPLTNIASLLTEFPDARREIREIVIMGGAYGITEYGVGNETPVAEFNSYSDPEAAKIVFETDVKLKTVGLDVTTIPHLELTTKDYDRIKKGREKVAAFAARILERNMREHGRFTLHDPMAVAVAIRPSFYKFSDYHVRIETKGKYTTGMTVADRRVWLSPDKLQGNAVTVCNDVDPRFKQLFLERLIAA